jgi:hypothetical protein
LFREYLNILDFNLVNIFRSKTYVLVPVPFLMIVFTLEQKLKENCFAVVAAERVVPTKFMITILLSCVPGKNFIEIEN